MSADPSAADEPSSLANEVDRPDIFAASSPRAAAAPSKAALIKGPLQAGNLGGAVGGQPRRRSRRLSTPDNVLGASAGKKKGLRALFYSEQRRSAGK